MMKSSHSVISLIPMILALAVFGLFSVWESASVLAQAPKKEKFVSTVLTPEGVRILKIDYPCEKHPTASVEVRVLTPGALKDPGVTNPIFFQSRWMDRKDLQNYVVKDVLDDCFLGDEDDYLVQTLKFEKPELTMNVLGWVGAFGVRDSVVRIKTKNPHTNDLETTLVFPNASRSQIGKLPSKADPFSSKAFGFDLIGTEFDQPCELLVWVLRGEKILIEETLHWDGHMEKPYEEKIIKTDNSGRIKKKKDDFFDDEEGDDSGDDDSGDDDSGDDDSGDDDSGDDDSGDDDSGDDDSGDDDSGDEDFFDEE